MNRLGHLSRLCPSVMLRPSFHSRKTFPIPPVSSRISRFAPSNFLHRPPAFTKATRHFSQDPPNKSQKKASDYVKLAFNKVREQIKENLNDPEKLKNYWKWLVSFGLGIMGTTLVMAHKSETAEEKDKTIKDLIGFVEKFNNAKNETDVGAEVDLLKEAVQKIRYFYWLSHPANSNLNLARRGFAILMRCNDPIIYLEAAKNLRMILGSIKSTESLGQFLALEKDLSEKINQMNETTPRLHLFEFVKTYRFVLQIIFDYCERGAGIGIKDRIRIRQCVNKFKGYFQSWPDYQHEGGLASLVIKNLPARVENDDYKKIGHDFLEALTIKDPKLLGSWIRNNYEIILNLPHGEIQPDILRNMSGIKMDNPQNVEQIFFHHWIAGELFGSGNFPFLTNDIRSFGIYHNLGEISRLIKGIKEQTNTDIPIAERVDDENIVEALIKLIDKDNKDMPWQAFYEIGTILYKIQKNSFRYTGDLPNRINEGLILLHDKSNYYRPDDAMHVARALKDFKKDRDNINQAEWALEVLKDDIVDVCFPVHNFLCATHKKFGPIDELRDNFQDKDIQVVEGPAGIGKTMLARTYAQKFFWDYSTIHWIKADKLHENQDLISNLKKESGWLLIIDGVDQTNINSIGVLPVKQGHVLITTRQFDKFDNHLPHYRVNKMIHEGFSTIESILLLMTDPESRYDIDNIEMHAKILNFVRTSSNPDEVRDFLKHVPEEQQQVYDKALKLVASLHRFPLALGQLKAKMVKNKMTLSDLVKEFETRGMDIFNEEVYGINVNATYDSIVNDSTRSHIFFDQLAAHRKAKTQA